FLSVYETAVVDRALVPPGSLKARLLWHLERLGCSLADLVLLDTEADCAFFRATYGRGRYARLWVGAEEPPPVANGGLRQNEGLDVLFVGTFIPLHGIEHILRAAAILQSTAPEVRITLIGSGQTYAVMQGLAKELALTNLIWGPTWLDTPELAERCTSADLLLGIFGTSDKAQRVIPLKAFAALAYARPLLTADTPGIREALQHGETAFLCPPGDPAALAEAILAIRDAPELAAQVAAQGHALYREQFTPSAIGALAIQLLTPLTERRNRR
ncbi:MAG: glycosyltransferase, partial [Anaerolineales bacterium]